MHCNALQLSSEDNSMWKCCVQMSPCPQLRSLCPVFLANDWILWINRHRDLLRTKFLGERGITEESPTNSGREQGIRNPWDSNQPPTMPQLLGSMNTVVLGLDSANWLILSRDAIDMSYWKKTCDVVFTTKKAPPNPDLHVSEEDYVLDFFRSQQASWLS